MQETTSARATRTMVQKPLVSDGVCKRICKRDAVGLPVTGDAPVDGATATPLAHTHAVPPGPFPGRRHAGTEAFLRPGTTACRPPPGPCISPSRAEAQRRTPSWTNSTPGSRRRTGNRGPLRGARGQRRGARQRHSSAMAPAGRFPVRRRPLPRYGASMRERPCAGISARPGGCRSPSPGARSGRALGAATRSPG